MQQLLQLRMSWDICDVPGFAETFQKWGTIMNTKPRRTDRCR
jgi:hypothetical protein